MATESPPIYVVMGVSGCGKSTVGQLLASRTGVPYLEGDQLHSPQNIARMSAGIALTDLDRQDWLKALSNHIGAARANNKGLVVGCSALKRAYRDILRLEAHDLRFVHLRGDESMLTERMAGRKGHYMPTSLLHSQLAILEPPAADEIAQTYDASLPPATIVTAVQAATF